MRTRWVLCFMVLVSLMLGATDADAKRRRKKKKSRKPAGPPALVVLPFEGDGKRGRKLAKSLALELELVDTIAIQRGKKLKRDVAKRKGKAFGARTLSRILKKRKTDIVIRGVRGWSEDGDEVTWVVVYGKKGKARFFESFPLSKDTDGMAQEIGVALEPVLASWTQQKPVKVVFPPEPEGPKGDNELFVDDSELEGGPKTKKKKKKKGKNKALEEIRKAREKKGKGKKDKASRSTSPDEEDGPKDEEGKARLSDLDKDREKRLDAEDEEKKEEGEDEPDLSHLIAVSLSVGGGTHVRSFSPATPGQEEPTYFLAMGGPHLRVSFWPIEWVGVDADAGFNVASYSQDVEGLLPQSQLGIRPSFAGAMKARYILHLGPVGVGGGFRLGGRYQGQIVPQEQRAGDGDLFTLFPTTHFYGLALGPELFFSVVLFGNRFEVEPRLDLVPLAVMQEFPDWPGQKSQSLGWHAQTTVRAEIFFGAFAELVLWHVGTGTNWHDGPGTRRGRLLNPQSGKRDYIAGGLVFNFDEGAQVGVGWMW